ncbi:MAG: DUF401 family protein [Planctomycetota bacterium]|nr:DUF401 family protein [Planctomycetota bacterium]
MPLFKVFLILSLLGMFVRLKCPIGFSLLISAAMLGAIFGMAPGDLASDMWTGLTRGQSIEFAMVIGALLVMSNSLERSGRMDRIAKSLSLLLPGNRSVLVVLPGLVGLLPMPGGAMFSAPMVKATDQESEMSPESHTAVNYWFRHVWEYCWPLYPGLIYAANLVGVPARVLVSRQWPLSICALLCGCFFLLPRKKSAKKATQPAQENAGSQAGAATGAPLSVPAVPSSPAAVTRPDTAVRALPPPRGKAQALFMLLRDFSPVLSVLIIFIVTALPLSLCVASGALISAVATIAAGEVAVGLSGRRTFLDKNFLLFVLLGFGTMVFGYIVDRSGAATQIVSFLSQHVAYAPLVAAMVMPMIVGALTGLTLAFVATALPLVLRMEAMGVDPLPITVLAYACGFVGVLLSPAHACLVLTNEYFGSKLSRVYKLILPPLAMLVVMGLAMYFLLR